MKFLFHFFAALLAVCTPNVLGWTTYFHHTTTHDPGWTTTHDWTTHHPGMTTDDPENCRRTLMIPRGGYIDVTSPGYPNNYPNNADCEWIIYTEDNTRILVEHWDFETERNFDLYSAGHGKQPSKNTSEIWEHSGFELPEDFSSVGGSVWITFTSDYVVSAKGFRNRIYDAGSSSCSNLCGYDNPFQGCSCESHCVFNDTCCSDYFEACAGDCVEEIVVPERGQVEITSPNYPANYPNDALCQWKISSERGNEMLVRFTEFYTEQGYDFFFAGDGDYPSQESSVIWAHSGFTAPNDYLSDDSSIWMRFVSDGSVTEKGFHIVVEDMDEQGGSCVDMCNQYNFDFHCSCQRDCVFNANCCPGYFELCAGGCVESYVVAAGELVDIYSPNYPLDYPNDARCEYIVSHNSTGGRLYVGFYDFSTEQDYDFFFAGHGDEPDISGSTVISAHSGQDLPPSFTSEEDAVWMRFTSDSTTTDRGFHAFVEDLGPSCRGICNSYNAEYRCSCYNDCFYYDECCPDYFWVCTEACGSDLYIEAGESVYITSPNYPDLYPSNSACKWTVSTTGARLRVSVTDFALDECCDYYSAGNGYQPSQNSSVVWRLPGTVAPADFESDGPEVWITFTSDSSIERRGFNVTVTDEGVTCRDHCNDYNFVFGCSCMTDCVYYDECCPDFMEECQGTCGGDFTVYDGDSVVISSPNYPEPYPNNTACKWTVNSPNGTYLFVYFKSFDLEQGFDFFSSGRGFQPSQNSSDVWMHSGSVAPANYLSVGTAMWLTFTSDNIIDDTGFQLTVTDVACETDVVVPSGGKVTVTSPNYPDPYPDNMRCSWNISSESGGSMFVAFQNFDLEDGFDFLSAGNGGLPSQETAVIWQHTGNFLPPDFTSTGPLVWIAMYSDSSVAGLGFRVILTDMGSKK
ncbi:CUB and sushi domain-containing protein 1-like [Ptychodera flava]|uniref:CUB and sushi domain-containing protein 1-like n=1 Tax=Ptychodera flava TaxID=63121 RepID=UPI00396A0724